MTPDASTTAGSTTSLEAVACIDVGRHVQVEKDRWGGELIFVNLDPKVLMRKTTDSTNAWSDWDELTLGNKEHRDRFAQWKDECRSNMIPNISEGWVCTSDKARDGWLEIFEEGFKAETGENGLFKDETITLKYADALSDQTSSSSSTDLGSQGLSEKTTARHPINSVTFFGPNGTVKTFSGGAEVSASSALSH